MRLQGRLEYFVEKCTERDLNGDMKISHEEELAHEGYLASE